MDAFTQADDIMRGSPNPQGLPGSGVMGHIGGALAALGLANDAYDMSKRGVNGENGLSAASNALGVGAWLASGTPAGALMASAAGGMAYGGAANNYIADTGTLGKNVDGSNRNWSDMAADWGTAADEAVGGRRSRHGGRPGIGATVAGSVVGTAGAIGTSAMVAGDVALEIGGAGLDLAGDAWDSIWD